MVDAKNGESYDGTLEAIDSFMNIQMSNVIITSSTGKFSKCVEVFIRGNNIKSIQFDQNIVKQHQEDMKQRQAENLESKRKRDLERKQFREQQN